jgi:hypothetical protein
MIGRIKAISNKETLDGEHSGLSSRMTLVDEG